MDQDGMEEEKLFLLYNVQCFVLTESEDQTSWRANKLPLSCVAYLQSSCCFNQVIKNIYYYYYYLK